MEAHAVMCVIARRRRRHKSNRYRKRRKEKEKRPNTAMIGGMGDDGDDVCSVAGTMNGDMWRGNHVNDQNIRSHTYMGDWWMEDME